MNRKFIVSAPGRVCLYGEHQDYLGMPSVVMAVNLRCRIKIEERDDRKVVWSSPKLGDEYSGEYNLDNLKCSEIDGEQDHKLASMILAERRGQLPVKGWTATIDSDIPVQAGCSSSSALLVAWIAAMQRLFGFVTSPIELANLAYEAEVKYFDAPGGNMDQIACAVGGVLRVDPTEKDGYRELENPNFDFVIGDSNTPKDTMGILTRCKFDRLDILEARGGNWDEIDQTNLSEDELSIVKGTIRNRNIERVASGILSGDSKSENLGELMTEHHSILRDVLKISTPRIESMCDAAIDAGGVGAKIFGSGGGGCMLAMVERKDGSPNIQALDRVKSSIETVDGAIAHQVVSEPGVSWGDEIENPVIILAAGASSRMKKAEGFSESTTEEVTTRPKAMLRVGKDNTPFLDLLIRRIQNEGSNCIVVVIGEHDKISRKYFEENPIEGVEIRFVVQTIPPDRSKPLGTSQAVQIALENNRDLQRHSVVVCNGDNMPPENSFSEIFNDPCAMLAYDSGALNLPDDRVSAFAIVSVTEDGKLDEIIEKPKRELIPSFVQSDGVLRVSMNTFRMQFNNLLKAVQNCPLSERDEKELPIAIGIWNKKNPNQITAIPFSGEFLDLTHPSDFEFVLNKLQ